MVSVQGYSANVAFKANEQSVKTNDKKPFETHAGLKTGAAYVGAAAAGTVVSYSFGKNIGKFLRNMLQEAGSEVDDIARAGLESADVALKGAKKSLFIGLPVYILASLGCGALIDKKINKKHAELAQKAQEKDAKEVLAEDERAELTRSGNLYHKSNTGKKLGAALGAIVYPAFSLLQKYAFKIPHVGIITSVVIGALGGLGLGAITDACSNKAARKHADRQVQIDA